MWVWMILGLIINFLPHVITITLQRPKVSKTLGFNKDNPQWAQEHIYDNTRPEMLPYLEKIRRLLDEYDAISLGEIVAKIHFQPSENTQMSKAAYGILF